MYTNQRNRIVPDLPQILTLPPSWHQWIIPGWIISVHQQLVLHGRAYYVCQQREMQAGLSTGGRLAKTRDKRLPFASISMLAFLSIGTQLDLNCLFYLSHYALTHSLTHSLLTCSFTQQHICHNILVWEVRLQ